MAQTSNETQFKLNFVEESMITIIPNWHPILVHFTIGLLSTSVLFYLARIFLPNTHRWREQWLNMANWSLWSGSLFAIATVIAGWVAYNSVEHDTASHAAMTLHRNWALPTAALFLIIAVSAVNIAKNNNKLGVKFLSASVIALVLLMITGWLGAEAVYRYGLGVMSLPQVQIGADGHNHSHGDNTDKKDEHGNVDGELKQQPHAHMEEHEVVSESLDGTNKVPSDSENQSHQHDH
jgi:uncharacterized membrane protein